MIEKIVNILLVSLVVIFIAYVLRKEVIRQKMQSRSEENLDLEQPSGTAAPGKRFAAYILYHFTKIPCH